MENKKGQALIEFILILPFVIYMCFILFDLGNMLINKNKLNSTMDEVVSIYKNTNNEEEIKKYLKLNDISDFKIKNQGEFKKIIIKQKINFSTIGIKQLFKNKKIKVERIIYSES